MAGAAHIVRIWPAGFDRDCAAGLFADAKPTRMIRSLADNGLVIRASDAKDRRRQTVVISPAGQQLIDDNLVQATQIAANYRDQLGAERYELLLDLLTELEQGPPYPVKRA